MKTLVLAHTHDIPLPPAPSREQQAAVKAYRHDQTQIEVDLLYPINSTGAEQKKIKAELFFYVPNSLGELSKVCDKSQFYRGITNYFRFKSPDLKRLNINILSDLKDYLRVAKQVALSSDEVSRYSKEVRLFASGLNRMLKDIQQNLGNHHDSQLLDELLGLQADVTWFRDHIVDPLRQARLWLPKDLRKIVLLCDEYISNRIHYSLSQEFKTLKSMAGERSKLSRSMLEILKSEADYRKSMNKVFFLGGDEPSDREYLSYRDSLLKKHVSRPLYIESNRRAQGSVYRNMVAAFGAALAACWTTVMELKVYRESLGEDIGLEFFMVVAIGILIYVFKDRIKDLSKEYFNEKLKKHLPDYKSDLTHPDLRSRGNRLGFYEECLRYIKSDRVPDDIKFVRKLKGRRDIESHHLESVIHYEKKICLEQKLICEAWPDAHSIKEVFRFNLHDLLRNLADPLKNLTVFDVEDGPVDLGVPRNYHINMVIRVSTDEDMNILHYRAVINKTGILRLEEVVSFGEIQVDHDWWEVVSNL
ncbi:hypothetical protein [Pseudobacteriovorax antillogorgiicola]|uniref:Uncharacterized protein n=1 Tax=Pseudobacteriovorax antillogorgiicola TaxID=1513793 RepID=A0A1Y6C1K1_9BACT|nr:hypothetical protein [Pseudobacteriovorax antillogorgiicola]TCS51226.1 hypothetical protein EDD56_111111 [Pseudobacteriovorax antillogorgiicola]SMF36944.1 hypothetical protein SAMN06296036_11167 [Pseudobacteriovorax antillogorgiicola]